MSPAPRRPTQGTITRGTTAPNRLRRVDRWLVGTQVARLRGAGERPLVVDLGFGATPITTSELAARLAPHLPGMHVIGAEIDPDRVAAAQPLARPGLEFVRSGFELGALRERIGTGRGEDGLALLRAFNVLRQYDESQVSAAWAQMCAHLHPRGLLIDGTCDELGRRAVWVALGRNGPETVTFSWRLAGLEVPSVLAERLPKVLIHRNVPGEAIHDWWQAFDAAWAWAAPFGAYGARQRFIEAVRQVRAQGWPVLGGASRWRLGELTLPWGRLAPRGWAGRQERE